MTFLEKFLLKLRQHNTTLVAIGIIVSVLAFAKIIDISWLGWTLAMLAIVYAINQGGQAKQALDEFKNNRSSVKKLEHYFICDLTKDEDTKARREAWERLVSVTEYPYFFATILTIGLVIVSSTWNSFVPLAVVTIAWFLVMVLIAAPPYLLRFTHKYPTIAFFAIPAVAGVFLLLTSTPFTNSPPFVWGVIYVAYSVVLFTLYSLAIPVHILRRVRSHAVTVILIVTILMSFLPQVASFLLGMFLIPGPLSRDDYEAFINALKMDPTVTASLNTNELYDLFSDLLNQIFQLLLQQWATPIIAMIGVAISSALLVGRGMVDRKITKNRIDAQNKYQALRLADNSANYETFREISFLGGDQFDNLLLSDDSYIALIQDNEGDLIRKLREELHPR